jgi:hypothetical protein
VEWRATRGLGRPEESAAQTREASERSGLELAGALAIEVTESCGRKNGGEKARTVHNRWHLRALNIILLPHISPQSLLLAPHLTHPIHHKPTFIPSTPR